MSGEGQQRTVMTNATKNDYTDCISRLKTFWRYIRGIICVECQSKGTWSNGKGAHSYGNVGVTLDSKVTSSTAVRRCGFESRCIHLHFAACIIFVFIVVISF